MPAANPSVGSLTFATIPVRVSASRPTSSTSPHDSGFSPSLISRTTPSPTSPTFTSRTSLSPSHTTPTSLRITTTFSSPTPSHESTSSNSTISSSSEDWKSCKSTLSPTELSARSAVALPRIYDLEQQRPREIRKHIVLNEPQEKAMTLDEALTARGRIPGPYIAAQSSAEMVVKQSVEVGGHGQADPTSWWAYFYTSSENPASVVKRGDGTVPVVETGEKRVQKSGKKGVQKREKKGGWKTRCGLGGCFGKK